MYINNILKKYAKRQITPLKLNNIYNFNKKRFKEKKINQSKFVYDEMLIRLSHRVFDLLKLPYGLPTIKPVKEVIDLYAYSFDRIKSVEKPNNETQCKDLAELLSDIKNQHNYLEENISNGIKILNQNYDYKLLDYNIINYELDKFFSSRVGIRTLISLNSHFIEGGNLIQNCNISELIEDTVGEVKYIYDANFDDEIEISVLDKEKDVIIPYIPSHIKFVLREILKNSVVSHYTNNIENEKITVDYTEGIDDVIIKISDRGLGFPRTKLNKMYSYSYTTSPFENVPEYGLVNKPLIAGYGYGLPLSKIYCRYFGGDLVINPLENIGTDVIIYINKIGEETVI